MTAGHASATEWEDVARLPHVLREYALVADGERGALVGPRGEISWMCFPAWDSAAIFSSLLGGGGSYVVTPQHRSVWGGYYEPGTLIWRSRWVTEHGVVECREALARPADPQRAVLLRQVHGQEGSHRIAVALDARHDFGGAAMGHIWRIDETTMSASTGGVFARWQIPAEGVRDAAGDCPFALTVDVGPGSVLDFVLELSSQPFAAGPPDAARLWRATEASWQSSNDLFDHRTSRDAVHAHTVLTGLTTSSGGTVAAATTSLPERADAGRNYDYRYVWIRDQSYIGQSAAAARAHGLLDASVSFVCDRLLADGPDLMPAYTTTGCRIADERSLELPGYPGGVDIVGNHVNAQFQLDIFGESLLLFAAADRAGRLDAVGWRAATLAADAIERRWQEEDAGLWELSRKAWTESRLQCASGLRQMSARRPGSAVAARWITLADRIVDHTTAQSLHPSGRWQRAANDERVDASLLLPGLRGAIRSDDRRTTATIAAVEHELTQDGYVYRYRPDQRPLGDAEGAFLLCGFWLALSKWQQGDRAAAVRWFDRNRTACGPPGLLSEEFDVRQRQLRGNLPQAFVHALLLETAATIGDVA